MWGVAVGVTSHSLDRTLQNIDLHALTSWIPERIGVKEKEVETDKLFKMMESSYRKGRKV